MSDKQPSPSVASEVQKMVEKAKGIRASSGIAGAKATLEELWQPLDPDALTVVPPSRRWIFKHPGGEGLLPRGRVGLLGAEGGAGKTEALVEAAFSVVTGRSWFEYFHVDQEAIGGKVLLLLGEEDHEEVVRRMWKIAHALRLSEDQKRLCIERITVIPLYGRTMPLTTSTNGRMEETSAIEPLRDRLTT